MSNTTEELQMKMTHKQLEELKQHKQETEIILAKWISGELSNYHEIMKATSIMSLDRSYSKDRTLEEKLFEDLSMLSYLTIIYGPIKLKMMVDTAVTVGNVMRETHIMADKYWSNELF